MVSKSGEKWLEDGWSPLRWIYNVVSAVFTAIAVIGYIKERHHPSGIGYLVGGLAVAIVWQEKQSEKVSCVTSCS